MGEMTGIIGFQKISLTEGKMILKECWGKHRDNPHEKIKPMMKNPSFDVLQRQVKYGNSIVQNKFSFVVLWKYFHIGLCMV